jgi:arylamine N-acetyltransferase
MPQPYRVPTRESVDIYFETSTTPPIHRSSASISTSVHDGGTSARTPRAHHLFPLHMEPPNSNRRQTTFLPSLKKQYIQSTSDQSPPPCGSSTIIQPNHRRCSNTLYRAESATSSFRCRTSQCWQQNHPPRVQYVQAIHWSLQVPGSLWS